MFLIPEIEFVQLSDAQWAMINLTNAATDIVSKELYDQLSDKKFSTIDKGLISKLLERSYLFDDFEAYSHYIAELNTAISIDEKIVYRIFSSYLLMHVI